MAQQRLFRWMMGLMLAAGLILPVAQPAAGQSEGARTAVVLKLSGALNPIWEQYLERGIRTAEQRQAEVLVLELNTPGGSIDLMNVLVQQIRNSPVPVVVYVGPAGAMAGSAGTLLTLAGHLSAMAPETAIGAASPVGSQGEDIGQTMESKVKEILKATVRTLAEQRGPQAIQLAEETIDKARAVSATEALAAGLVDFKANDVGDLLTQMDGRTVKVLGVERTLHTSGAEVVKVPVTFVEQLLQILASPNLVFILLSVGVQALLIELSSPGGWVAGFIGAVCLTIAVFGLGILPVNWFGIIFLVIAFVLFLLDIKAPTHGALTAAGVASFIVGGLVLFNSPNVPAFQRVSVPLVVGVGISFGALFFAVVTFALRAQKVPILAGQESLVGQVGVARSDLAPRGSVLVNSEMWSAELVGDGEPVTKGTRVKVLSVEGIHIRVTRVEEKD